MTTTLALSPKLASAVQPKPTKTEIIEALAILKKEKEDKENLEGTQRREKLLAEFEKEIIPWAIKNHSSLQVDFCEGHEEHSTIDGKYQPNGKLYGCQVEIVMKTLPNNLMKKLKTIYSLPNYYRARNLDSVRKEVRSALSGSSSSSERIKALIESDDSKKALEKMLSHIGL